MSRLWCNGPLLLALTMLFWSGSVVVGRAAADLVPPVLFTLLRWAGALAIAAPVAWPHLRRDMARMLERRWTVLLLALLSTVAYNILVYRGLHQTTAVNALLMQSVMPLAILGVALLFGERPGLLQGVAILVSIGGVLTIAAQGSVTTLLSLRFNPGDLLILTAVVSYALYSVVLRRRPLVHPFSLLTVFCAVGMVVLVPMAWAEHAAGARMEITPASIAAVVYAGLFASFLATLFYNRGLELLGSARGGQYTHLMPVFGTVLAVVFLHERLQSYHFVGIALIAAGLLLASRPSRPA